MVLFVYEMCSDQICWPHRHFGFWSATKLQNNHLSRVEETCWKPKVEREMEYKEKWNKLSSVQKRRFCVVRNNKTPVLLEILLFYYSILTLFPKVLII
jgi:hypothetical protein